MCYLPLRHMKLSVVVPTYNEERTIGQVLDAVLNLDLSSSLGVEMEKEVIVVDDGSCDGTRAILETFRDAPEVRLILHERNKGKGAAVRSGFAVTTGDIVLIQDADFEYDPVEYPQLLDPIVQGRADVVYGSRLSGAGP